VKVTQGKIMSDPISTELTSYETTERSLPILPVRDTVLSPCGAASDGGARKFRAVD
jgi:hypothetical protein